MLGTRQSRAGALARETSPLASQLQQAWLQSQILSQAPKLQKRGFTTLGEDDVSVQNRVVQQFHQVASDLSSIVADHASHTGFPHVVKKEDLYFHKTRLETPEFPRRPETPQLVSYSRKADKPQKPRSGNFLDRRSSSSSSLSSASSGSLSPSSTVSFESVQLHQEFDAPLDIADYANSGTLDLACQSEPLVRFLDGMLAEDNMDGKKFTLQEGFDYHAIAKEFNDLGRPNLASECGSNDFADGDYDMSWAFMGILPTEEAVADKLIHAYTSNLNKHVTDVSENVDSSTWVNERDACTDHSDQSWDWYLERLRPKPTSRSLSSSIFQGDSLGQDMSPDALSAFPAVCVDLKTLLLKCAFVVSKDDVRTANDLIRELRMHSSVHGTALQRMAYYYMEALVAKMSGTGPQLYMAITSNTPSTATMLKAHRLFVDYSPYIKVTHFFSTKTILDAFEGADRVHLVDYGVAYGAQWPCLIQRLSQRKGGPPHLRITCIDLPQPGGKVSARVKEVGCRLAEFAQLWEVPFEFNALADKWESITSAHLNLNQDEVLAVNCQYRLRNLLDESIMAASPRKLVLEKIRSMNPKVFVMLTVNADYNAPFFMTRFRESMKYYFTMFDAMEVSMPANDPDRVILEREFYGREILNIVACEGVERVERAEPYRQWQTLTQRAGFTKKPLSPIITSKIKAMMGSYHKDYGVGEDGGWFLMGWKNQIVRAMTVWEPTPATTAT